MLPMFDHTNGDAIWSCAVKAPTSGPPLPLSNLKVPPEAWMNDVSAGEVLYTLMVLPPLCTVWRGMAMAPSGPLILTSGPAFKKVNVNAGGGVCEVALAL